VGFFCFCLVFSFFFFFSYIFFSGCLCVVFFFFFFFFLFISFVFFGVECLVALCGAFCGCFFSHLLTEVLARFDIFLPMLATHRNPLRSLFYPLEGSHWRPFPLSVCGRPKLRESGIIDYRLRFLLVWNWNTWPQHYLPLLNLLLEIESTGLPFPFASRLPIA